MEDTNSINRELKKQQLRKQIVSNPNPMRTGSSSYQGDGQEDEGSGLGGSGLLRRGIMIYWQEMAVGQGWKAALRLMKISGKI